MMKDWRTWLPPFLLAFVLLVLLLKWASLGSFRFMMGRSFAFTGFPFASRQYAVLVQNTDHLMPTGGSITRIGELSFSYGVANDIQWVPADEFADLPEQPLLVMRTLLDGNYTLAQANHDPSLKTSIQALDEFMPMDEFDGVITITEGFIDELGGELTWNTLTDDKDRLMQAFNQKEVQASFTRGRLAEAFAKRGWDGELPAGESGDVLAIAEANFSTLDTSPVVIRDIQYEIDVLEETDILGNPVAKALLTVKLSHEGSTGVHRSYLRSMLPLASDLNSPFEVAEEREDLESLGEMVVLEPGDSVTYNYSYELPEFVWVDGEYKLKLVKQAGTEGDNLRVIVRVPVGMSLETEQFSVHDNVGIYNTRLTTDQDLSFQVVQDKTAPELLNAQFSAWNEVTLDFNERMGDSAEDPSRYRVSGLSVLSATLKGTQVILRTEGMVQSDEPVERTLTVRDLQDKRGNTIENETLELSLIQSPELAPPSQAVDNEVVETNPETPSE